MNETQGHDAAPLTASNGVSSSPWVVPCICILLATMVWAVFGQTLRHDFVNIDDDLYVYENPDVRTGVSLEGTAWAFTHVQVGHWDPLTTLSHMLDCSIYGARPWGHHLTNVILHAAAAILLFLVLQRMTGALWRSAFVAAVFAIHPLRVESVAWVSERKDMLSGVFFMLAIGAYAHYTRRPRSLPRYAGALALFALGLISKSMLVTLPFVLLLLDFWPLGRFAQPGSTRRLILEKTPFFALSIAAGVVQMFSNGSTPSVEKLSLLVRVSNALVSCMAYLGQMIFPADLAMGYIYPGNHLPAWESVFAAMALASISVGAFILRRKCPFLVVGWLWYLGMLAPPMAGLIRVGQAQADRYTYLPQIGLYIAITWLAAMICAILPYRRVAAGGVAAIMIAALMWRSWIQAGYWKDSLTLWNHTLAVTGNNAMAQYSLGAAFLKNGRVDEAIAHYRKALEINPSLAEAHNNLGIALQQKGNVDEADEHFTKALEIKPGYAEAHYNLGNALAQEGHADLAITQYLMALKNMPGMLDAHLNLGNIYGQRGEVDEAITQYEEVLKINPKYDKALYNLGYAFQQKGETAQAIAQYGKALEVQPGFPATLTSLAYLLATCPRAPLRNGPKAVALAQQADRATGNRSPVVLRTLAAAYAETGRFPEAVEAAQRALELAGPQSDKTLTDSLRYQLALYKAGEPFRDESLK